MILYAMDRCNKVDNEMMEEEYERNAKVHDERNIDEGRQRLAKDLDEAKEWAKEFFKE